jgi:hypothetical protein
LRRRALVATIGCAVALAASGAAVAQEGAAGPSLLIVGADPRQTGGDLEFEARRGDVVRVYRAVNIAIGRAAAQPGDGARVIDLVPVSTPGGLFRQTITFRGRTVSARQDDGIHLSPAGAAIAATLVIDRLRADGAL